MRLPVLTLAVVLLAGLGQAQPRSPGAVPVVFDDFAYGSRAALLAPVTWTTRLDAPRPATRCTGGPGCERLWYHGNWRDEGAAGSRLSVPDATHVRLQSLPGDTLRYGSPASHPPWLQTGMMAATGTWVAQVRLEDIRRVDARHGTPRGMPFLSDAFWVLSPHYGSRTAGFDRVHASEINHEWNNYFYTPRTNPRDPSTALAIDQFMATGLTVDGECQGLCPNGVATGELHMADPALAGARPLTCRVQDGRGPARHLPDERACHEAFVSGGRDGRRPRASVLLIQYDGLDVRWAAVAVDARAPGASDDRVVSMSRTIRVGRRTQPMAAVLSQILAPTSLCRQQGLDVARCTVQDPVGFDVDWFLYSPDAGVTVDDARSYAAWFRAQALTNVNTTGLALAAPAAPPPAASARLLTPAHTVAGAHAEWTFVPPLAWNDPAGASNLSWRLTWRYRTRAHATAPWSHWQPVPGDGFSVDAPATRSDVEVEVTAVDWHPAAHSEPIRRCRGLRRDGTEVACVADGAGQGRRP